MTLLRLSCAASLVLFLALGRAAAQDTPEVPAPEAPTPPQPDEPKPEAPRPDEPKPEPPQPGEPKPGPVKAGEEDDGAPGGDQVEVEHPNELKRIEDALARIVSERKRLHGDEGGLRAQKVSFATKDLSPQLAPRDEVLGLTLAQAVEAALLNNPDYLVALLDARAAEEGVDVARAAFDPSLTFSGTYSQSRSPFFSANPFSGFPPGFAVNGSRQQNFQTSVSQLLPTGTQLQLSWTEVRTLSANSFALNPSYSPSLSFSVTQPLLRGFGVDVNLAALRTARSRADQSDATLADTYMSATLAIERAYWDLILNEEQLRSQKQGLDSALHLLRDTRKLRKFGYAIPLDVTIAKAGVASRREGVIVAESNLEAARDQMVRLIRPSSDATKWDLLVVPVDQPTLIPEPELDIATAIQKGLSRRPDYHSAQLALENAQRDLLVAENNALPSLNFVGGWTQQGLGSGHRSSWSRLGSGRFYTWSAGVQVQLPLFLRSERAAVRQAKFNLEKAEVGLRTIEANVVLEIRAAVRGIRTAKARIEAARAARILARQRLEATRKKVESGAAVPRDVLDDTADLANAETAEVQAYVNYRLAVSSLRRATGTLLDDLLQMLDPRVKRALERQRR
ncbi:MAG: TolC family protein [Planctomycetota bacterium]